MSVRTFSQEKQELLHIVMNEMEKRHFTVGEAEDFPETLAFHLEKNSERFTKGKPFAVFKKDHQEKCFTIAQQKVAFYP